MSYIYEWKVSNGDKVLVEYCWSTKDNCIKVVEMSVNGKFHRETWMSPEGRATMMDLLVEDYESKTTADASSILSSVMASENERRVVDAMEGLK